jgi:hypothetical protein
MTTVPEAERPAMHQIKIPLWMDRPYLKRLMKETGCSMKQAIKVAEKQERVDG